MVLDHRTAQALDELWDEVVGQPDAVAALRAAANAPVHAYLLVGPEGSGKRAAAAAFSAELLCRGLGAAEAERTVARVASGTHPCVYLVQRDGASISTEQVREVVRRSAMSPPEGELQIFVLDEFHLVSGVAPILLKSIEEPPDTTLFVVLAETVPDELVTIASRCVRLDLSPVPMAAIGDRLIAEGVAPELAQVAASTAAGSLRRARLLVTDTGLVQRRDAWLAVPDRLDGSGATACRIADELMQQIDDVQAPLSEVHAAEFAELEAIVEQTGMPRKGDGDRMSARHKREARRLRVDEMRSGLATLMGRFRSDVLAGQTGASDRFAEAAVAVQQFTDALEFNPSEALQLRALLLKLPRC